MQKRLILLMAAAGVTFLGTPIDARSKERDQGAAFAARQQGRILPLPEIEARIRQQMRGADYLGPELDTGTGIYRLKFLRGDRVIWVDVDGRTGAIVARSGH